MRATALYHLGNIGCIPLGPWEGRPGLPCPLGLPTALNGFSFRGGAPRGEAPIRSRAAQSSPRCGPSRGGAYSLEGVLSSTARAGLGLDSHYTARRPRLSQRAPSEGGGRVRQQMTIVPPGRVSVCPRHWRGTRRQQIIRRAAPERRSGSGADQPARARQAPQSLPLHPALQHGLQRGLQRQLATGGIRVERPCQRRHGARGLLVGPRTKQQQPPRPREPGRSDGRERTHGHTHTHKHRRGGLRLHTGGHGRATD